MKVLSAQGQTCNKFWTYINYIADSLETGEKLLILVPDITIKDYTNLLNSDIIKFPLYFEFLTKIIGYSSYIKLLKFVFANKVSEKVLGVIFSFIPRMHYVITGVGGYKSKNRKKYLKVILELFTPNQDLINEVKIIFRAVKKKNKIICGVHIRRGDYDTFKGGKYFYSNKQYHALMMDIKRIFSEKEVSFFVSSNEDIDLSVFNNCECFLIKEGNATKDLIGLSICDCIIGPPSTFSSWASIYNGVPLYHIEDANLNIEETSFIHIMDRIN